METYKKSIEDVDIALRRLNATLASYKISPAPSTTAATPHQRAQKREEPQKAAVVAGSADTAPRPANILPSNDISTLRERRPEHQPQDAVWKEVLDLRGTHTVLKEIKQHQLQETADAVSRLQHLLPDHGHCIPLHLILAQKYLQLGYPDLAAGASYKALLLCDAVQDTSDEYHESAATELRHVIQQVPIVERIRLLKSELHGDKPAPSRDTNEEMDVEVELWVREHYLLLTYRYLSWSLLLCECCKSAQKFALQGLKIYDDDIDLMAIHDSIRSQVLKHFNTDWMHLRQSEHADYNTWPEQGVVRREVYPWNEWEPDRLKDLPELNDMMADVAPKLEVKAVELPALLGVGDQTVVTQLGVFAKEDIAPGEIVLDETTMLTANNKLLDALCDACGADLPRLTDPEIANVHQCPHCEVVFCSEACCDRAEDSYHQAVCDADLDSLLRDVPPQEAADSLYALLLLRALAMAETQDLHPLELNEVKYIWGDFHNLPLATHWTPAETYMILERVEPDFHSKMPRTLPFTFDYSIRLPLQMLEKMDVDIFCSPQYDTWVFNTLYAKFRGTASARLSGQGGRRIRGPEVSAVHPMWCLANHSCNPNVRWEWGGSIKFWAVKEKLLWDDGKGGKVVKSVAGIKKGEEILNHYCDVDLPVKERREWARGPLGGDCMCERCVWEAGEAARENGEDEAVAADT